MCIIIINIAWGWGARRGGDGDGVYPGQGGAESRRARVHRIVDNRRRLGDPEPLEVQHNRNPGTTNTAPCHPCVDYTTQG